MEDDRDDLPEKKHRGLPFGPWGFPDIDEMMKEMEKAFTEQFKDLERELPKGLVRESKTADGGVKKEFGPIVYGYSVTIGPDGKPVVREFGNVRPGEGTPLEVQDKREPLVDVLSSDKEVRVIAEMPGVSKGDIDLTVNEKSVVISVDKKDRRYYKELDLPGTVDPKGAKSNYNNGILEVTIPLKAPTKGGARVRVD
ncbi:MAG: Hsp20/alpha crystallin family protein [Thaumarchaeota archaeon]|nr:Hsp20/alpha crystallin family protein [Nitrososphaerota archaeon]